MPLLIDRVVGRLSELEANVDEVKPVELDGQQRARGHLRLRTEDGLDLMVSLPRGQELSEGDVLWLEDRTALVVVAAQEDVLEVEPRSHREWALVCYHLGNLHRDVRFVDERVLTPYHAGIESFLGELGIPCVRDRRGFAGERPPGVASGSHG